MFLNNRHYDPSVGVFVSVDPLVTATGEPYIYGAANPIRFSDPSGLCTQFTMDADGNWTCEFFQTDGPRIAVDNGPLGSGFCVAAGGTIAIASVGQSAVDNNLIGGGEPCWGAFSYDVLLDGVSAVSGPVGGQFLSTGEAVFVGSLYVATTSGMGQVNSQVNGCG